KGERVWEPRCPGCFVVASALLNDDLQAVLTEAGGLQYVHERLKCGGPAAATSFPGSDTEHNALRPTVDGPRAIQEDAVAHSDGRALKQHSAENAGTSHDGVEGAGGAVRRPTEAGVRGIMKRGMGSIDEWHEEAEEESEIAIGARGIGVGVERVRNRQIIDRPPAIAAVVDADNDQWIDGACLDEMCSRLVHVPATAAGIRIAFAE